MRPRCCHTGTTPATIDYHYPARLPGEAPGPDEGGYNDIHFHSLEPLSFRLGLSARF